MQAGREIRVMVRPDDVDDIGAQVLARDVAKQIEEELTYPGQIRVTVVRESRASEVAASGPRDQLCSRVAAVTAVPPVDTPRQLTAAAGRATG